MQETKILVFLVILKSGLFIYLIIKLPGAHPVVVAVAEYKVIGRFDFAVQHGETEDGEG